MKYCSNFVFSATYVALLSLCQIASAADEKITLAEGKLALKAPEGWQKKKPLFAMIDHEFTIPKAEGDDADGRLTIMGATGSIDANINRWLGQFQTASGEKLTKDKAKIDKKQVAGEDVVVVELSGTYLDKPGGPASPAAVVERKNYRMLAGVVTTKTLGTYFFKLYGPEKTIEANEDKFKKMLDSLEKK